MNNNEKKMDPVLGKTESTNNNNNNNNVMSGHETQVKDSDVNGKSQPFHSLYHFIRCAGSADGGHVLHQIHYWISRPNIGKTDKRGRRFVFNTIENWQKDNFFWLNVGQLGRLLRELEDLELIETTTAFNSSPLDRKKWYTLNYAKIKMEESDQITEISTNNSLESNHSVRLFKNEESKEEISDYSKMNNAFFKNEECIIQNQTMHYSKMNDINTSNTKYQVIQKPNITKNQQPTQKEEFVDPEPKTKKVGEVGGMDRNLSQKENLSDSTINPRAVVCLLGTKEKKPAEGVGEVGMSKNSSQTEKIHNDAVAVLCAINNARSELKSIRPDSDKKNGKSDPLIYGYAEIDLQPIKNILTHHPKASLEVCLNVVAHRKAEAQQNPEANFKHLNCHWAWTEENFERCLKKMQADKKAVSPALAKPVVPKPVDWVPIKQEKASPEEEAENHQKWLESITGMRDQNMAAMFLRMANKEAAPVVEQKPIVTYQYKENFTEYLRNPKKADQDRLVEVEAMAKVLLNQKNDRERGYRKTDQELLDGVEKLAREAQTNRLVVEEVG